MTFHSEMYKVHKFQKLFLKLKTFEDTVWNLMVSNRWREIDATLNCGSLVFTTRFPEVDFCAIYRTKHGQSQNRPMGRVVLMEWAKPPWRKIDQFREILSSNVPIKMCIADFAGIFQFIMKLIFFLRGENMQFLHFIGVLVFALEDDLNSKWVTWGQYLWMFLRKCGFVIAIYLRK